MADCSSQRVQLDDVSTEAKQRGLQDLKCKIYTYLLRVSLVSLTQTLRTTCCTLVRIASCADR